MRGAGWDAGLWDAGIPRANGLATTSLVISLVSMIPVAPGILLTSVSNVLGESSYPLQDAFVLIGLPALPGSLIGVVGSVVGIVALIRSGGPKNTVVGLPSAASPPAFYRCCLC